MHRLATIALLLTALPALTHGLKCYSCQSSGETDTRCEKNPETANGNAVINCNVKYCTIRRREFVDPEGRVSSFHRSCEERPLYLNKMVASGGTITYYSSCQTDLCNSGDGVDVGSGGGGGDSGWLDGNNGGDLGGGGVVIVPGRGAAPGAAAVTWGVWLIGAMILTRLLL